MRSIYSHDVDVLASLKPVGSALYDSRSAPSGCLENTRTDVLDKLLSWADESSQRMSIFWLAGLAGTGKSAIAKTFCERLARPHTLFASFFASQSSADCRDPFNIIHTFAYELAIAQPAFCSHIISVLRSHPHIHERPMKEQIERLLADCFAGQLDGRTVVLVIDALDECEKIGRIEGGALIPLLADALRDYPVKLLVTSRQETTLVGMFNSLTHVPLRLHEIETTAVEADVRRILETGFADIRRDHGLTELLWPSQEELDALVRLTGHFLIFAATALRYIGDDRFTPMDQLREVLARDTTLEGEAPYAQIDALYQGILHTATRDGAGRVNLRLCRRIGSLLRTIALLEEPLSVPALAQIMGTPTNEVAKDVGALAAVLLVADDGSNGTSAPVQIFHPSLRDFLLDPQRCYDDHFAVISPQHDHDLAQRCLLIMNQLLVRNICRIDNFTTANSKISDLDARILEFVPGALQYACGAWPVHLMAGDCPDGTLRAALLEFSHSHLLHWLELMSLLGLLSVTAERLTTLSPWFRAVLMRVQLERDLEEWKTASNLLNDACRMLCIYYIPIELHALQVYYSALTTMPLCTLAELPRGDSNSIPRLLSARDSGWGSALSVMEGHTAHVTSVTFSPDASRVVSGSFDKTVRIWNTSTGRLLAVCEGHTSRVWSVALSPDGTQMASGSEDSTVRIWDTRTGVQLTVLNHETYVLSVAFSPHAPQIASGSLDMAVRLWDTRTGTLLALCEGHKSWVKSVAFSFDGSVIGSASSDWTVRIWDPCDSGRSSVVLGGHSAVVNSVAFAHNRTELVSASEDATMRVWDFRSRIGHVSVVLRGHEYGKGVLSAVFTPDDSHVISGSSDHTVRIWNARTGEQLATLDGHIAGVRSVGSSPDGCHIVSGSMDHMIIVWDWNSAEWRMCNQPPPASENQDGLGLVECVDFSSCGTRIVSGHRDESFVRLWDAGTGNQITIYKGHQSSVRCVAFSRDARRIASGSRGTLRVWNTGVNADDAEAAVLSCEGLVGSVAFSPDGALIVSASKETVTVWDMEKKGQPTVLAGHVGGIHSVVFSPSGAWIASASVWSSVMLWDARTFQQAVAISMERTLGSLVSVAFPDNDEFLQALTSRGRVIKWKLHRDICTQHGARLCQHGARLCQSQSCLLAEPSHIAERLLVTNLTSKAPYASDREIAIIWDQGTGWLSCVSANGDSQLPMCWLPTERRSSIFTSRGSKVVVGGKLRGMTILDFADTVAVLQGLGVV
jgi:WD40 repeat protein